MSVHIFVVSEQNYSVCIRRGLVGLPEADRPYVADGLISRVSSIREDDYILLYVLAKKELHGVWQADGLPFFDDSPVWDDKLYPLRCKIKCSKYCFNSPLSLYDINDLRNPGKLWTWSLQRASGSNAMFSISDTEFEILMREYMKSNPFSMNKWIIPETYPFHAENIMEHIHVENGSLKYESTVMAHLNRNFSLGKYTELFGNYTDFLSYVPTSLGREMDILLMFGNPDKKTDILSYDIIEVKRALFDEAALAQLIDYESWFLQKKAAGDLKTVRVSAIASDFSPDVIDYVRCRKKIEGKPIKLLKYCFTQNEGLLLQSIDEV